MDTRWAKMSQTLAQSPLEYSLGLPDFGRYATAPPSQEHAFVKLRDMWEEEVDNDQDSDAEEATAPDPQVQHAVEIIEKREQDQENTNRERTTTTERLHSSRSQQGTEDH
jgi:hypothetical protein